VPVKKERTLSSVIQLELENYYDKESKTTLF
jgi:hypothetical protein